MENYEKPKIDISLMDTAPLILQKFKIIWGENTPEFQTLKSMLPAYVPNEISLLEDVKKIKFLFVNLPNVFYIFINNDKTKIQTTIRTPKPFSQVLMESITVGENWNRYQFYKKVEDNKNIEVIRGSITQEHSQVLNSYAGNNIMYANVAKLRGNKILFSMDADANELLSNSIPTAMVEPDFLNKIRTYFKSIDSSMFDFFKIKGREEISYPQNGQNGAQYNSSFTFTYNDENYTQELTKEKIKEQIYALPKEGLASLDKCFNERYHASIIGGDSSDYDFATKVFTK